MDFHKPVEKVKVTATRQVRRVLGIAHSHTTEVMREYCHLLYFGAVFVEGHGLYSVTGGALLVFGVLAAVAGEEVE